MAARRVFDTCTSAALGLLATIYTQDLYMTWMTVPLAPLAVYGIVRTFRKDDIASQFWLAAPLAALWWAHSPIALWFTFIAAATQVVRLAYVRTSLDPFKRAILGAVIFAVLAPISVCVGRRDTYHRGRARRSWGR